MNRAIEKLILGTAQMGLNYGINNSGGKLTADQSEDVLKKAYESGIRYLDTAEVYGDAHKVVGAFHRSHSKMKFKVITKLSSTDGLDSIRLKVDHFLDELSINSIEGLLLHSFDLYNNNPKILSELQEIKDTGTVKYIGVSAYTNDELSFLIEDDKIDLIQIPFNLLDNLSRKGKLLKRAKDRNKIIHTRSTFLQGLFFKETDEEDKIVSMLKPGLQCIHAIAEKQKLSVAKLALNYCIQQNSIDKVLIGVDSLDQLKSNLAILGDPLENKLLKKIDQIETENEEFLNPTNW